MTDLAHQRCINPDCAATFSIDQTHVSCERCGALLDIIYDFAKLPNGPPRSLEFLENRGTSRLDDAESRLNFSGVWRFRELMPFFSSPNQIVTLGEGRTILQTADLLAKEVGVAAGKLQLQYEGLNPSGSFKDNGMTAAFTHARRVGARRVACASTGNTSASLAMYAAFAEMSAIVFIGSGKISFGKLSQALDYGALTLQIDGDFDACLRRVRQIAVDVPKLGVYLMNSVNPFRLEGQKSIMYRVLEARRWRVPDWIIVPGGNLGNCSAFGKAFAELHELGLIDRPPRLAVINAAGANTLNEVYTRQGVRWNGGRYDSKKIGQVYAAMDEANYHAHTVASAIEIGRPVNLPKALRALDTMNGVVREVSDEEILENRALIARYGFGCEPASAASVAGLRVLLEDGTISRDDEVVCILTGHELKDPNATVTYHTVDGKGGKWTNRPIAVEDDIGSIVKALGG